MGIFNEEKNVTNIDSFDCLDKDNKPIESYEDVMDLVFILDKSGSMHDLLMTQSAVSIHTPKKKNLRKPIEEVES